MITLCQTQFTDRQQLINYVAKLSGRSTEPASELWVGGSAHAQALMSSLDVVAYGRERNFLHGAVSRLSPYLRHGVLTPDELLEYVLTHHEPVEAEKFIQQLSWQAFFQHVHAQNPGLIWQDREPYKTGFSAQDYATELPEDIKLGQTGVRIIDQIIERLISLGYLHNHCRLYLASYVVHWRRIRWQAGARWFLEHLLDGDCAANNYSWQWVASTFSAKPYYFNLDNVRRFSAGLLDTEDESNVMFDASYEALQQRLFPDVKEPFQ